MDEEYVKYEEALGLKELGFDEYCMGACYYEYVYKKVPEMVLHTPDSYDSHSGVNAPLYQQAFKWFRKKYGLHSVVNIGITDEWYFEIFNIFSKRNVEISSQEEEQDMFNDYEEAELACLKKLIELAKQIKENDDLTSSDIVGY